MTFHPVSPVSVFGIWMLTAICRAQDTTGAGALAGIVLNDGARTPVAGARVCARVEPPRCVTTDSGGRFQLGELRSGKYEVDIKPPGLETPQATITMEVHAGIESTLELLVATLETQRQQIKVTASATAPEEVKTSNYLISPQTVRSSAGALKEVTRYVQTLPGVTFGGNDFRNDIVVRGGSPLENLYVVDNVEIPNINHFANFASAGGPVGLLNSELLADVTFLSGGYPAPYSNRLSSVLQVTQREGSRERLHTQATLGFGGAGVIAEGPLTKKGAWIASIRRSFLDLFTNDIGLGGVPVYTNVEGKAVYDLNARNRIWLVSLGGRDNITIRPDATKERQEADTTNFDYRGWRNASGLNWQQLMGARGVGLLGVTHSRATLSSQARDLRLADAVVSRNDSSEDEITLKYDLTLNLPVLERLQAGGSGHWFRIDYDNARPIGLENPYSPAPGRVNPLSVRQMFWTSQAAAYVQITRKFGSRLSLTAGGRADRYTYLQSTRFSPRLALTYRIAPRLSVNASSGTYYQQPFFSFIAADPVNRGLAPMRADHYVAGLAWTPNSSLRATMEVYEKRYRQYPVALQYPQISLASAGDDYGPSYYLFPMTSAGRGRARGIEFFVEKKLTARLYGQMNFSVSQARHAALDGVLRPGGFDSPRVFNLTGGYRLTKHWEAAVRYVVLSGRPYTPFDEQLSRQQDRGIYDLARVNAVRAPSYQRLDFRVDRTMHVWGGSLNVYFGLQNAFNRDNFLGYAWNFRTNAPKLQHQLGIFPLGGMEWRF
jgi:hypothetical protein